MDGRVHGISKQGLDSLMAPGPWVLQIERYDVRRLRRF